MKLIDKIRALKAKAEKTDNEHEAAAFAAKVQELLTKHNLHISDVEIDDEEQEDMERVTYDPRYTDPWRRVLCGATARLYMCDIYMDYMWDDKKQKTKTVVVFVGRPHNIVVAQEMFEYLVATTLRLAREYGRGDRKAQLGFERGCGLRLADRMEALRAEQTRGTPKRDVAGNPGNLPALYMDEAEQIAKIFEGLGLKTKSNRTKLNGHSAAGAEAAEGVSLNTQVGGRSATRLLT